MPILLNLLGVFYNPGMTFNWHLAALKHSRCFSLMQKQNDRLLADTRRVADANTSLIAQLAEARAQITALQEQLATVRADSNNAASLRDSLVQANTRIAASVSPFGIGRLGVAVNPVIISAGAPKQAAGSADRGKITEALRSLTLGELTPEMVDMRTLVIIGSSQTRRFPRADGGEWVYTPRWYPD